MVTDMNACLFVLLFLLGMGASASEVVAVGYGDTESAALQQAKLEATSKVAGAFITGRTDVEGDDVKQLITEYRGGFVRRYDVLSVESRDNLVEVIIKADVDEDKINNMIVSSGHKVSPAAIDAVRNAQVSYEELGNALLEIMDRNDKVATQIKSVTYKINGAKTQVTIAFEALWSPKWYDDLRNLAKASGPELGLLTGRDFGACFVGDRGILFLSIECYDVHQVLDLPNQLSFNVYATMRDGTRRDLGSVYSSSSPLYYQGQYDSRQAGMFLRKSGVIHETATIWVANNVLEGFTAFEVEPAMTTLGQ